MASECPSKSSAYYGVAIQRTHTTKIEIDAQRAALEVWKESQAARTQKNGPYRDELARVQEHQKYVWESSTEYADREVPPDERALVERRRTELKAFKASKAGKALGPRLSKRLVEHLARTPPEVTPFDVGTNGEGQRAAQEFLRHKGLLTNKDVDGSWGANSALAWRQWSSSASAEPVRYRSTEKRFTTLDDAKFEVGDKGPEVEKAIRALASRGLYRGKINPYWGPMAEDALKAYRLLKGREECLTREGADEAGRG